MIEALKNKVTNFIQHKKFRKLSAQAMVEFALALPILLMVVYGLLETGRLLFIYGSTVTAARQAARYGSASGIGPNGVPFYRDCTGIEAAVNNVAFIHTFSDINITYDRGLDNAGDMVAIPSIDADPSAYTCNSMNDTTLQNGDRIKVQAVAVWSPIVQIVPSWQGFTITSSAERTILKSVAVGVDPEAQQWIPGGALTIAVTTSTVSFDEIGDVISYTYTLKNVTDTSPTPFDLHATFTVIDNQATTDCSSAPGTLTPGSSFTCTGYHTITQADLDAGFVTNSAGALSLETASNLTGITVFALVDKSLLLEKTADTVSATSVGSVVTYTYTLTNDGNVTLTSPYTITDNKISAAQIDCSSAVSPLAYGASTTCTGTYTITNADITAGSVTNIASATALFNGTETITSNVDTATVNTSTLGLEISPSRTSVDLKDQVITYTYTLTNYDTSNFTSPYNITDNRATGISCPSTTITPGNSITCTGSYTVTQADMDAGLGITNQATATANSVTSNQASSTVTVTQTSGLGLTISPSPAIATVAGTNVTYDYTLTNNGNVSLSSPYSVSDTGHSATITCTAITPIAPGASTICTATYAVTTTDLSNGTIISSATANANFGSTVVTSAQATATVITYNGPRLTLSITATPVTYTSAGMPLNFTFTLKNTGNAVLSSPYSVTGNAFLGTITCPSSPASLGLGESVNCTASYISTATDVTNTAVNVSATASALNGAATLNSNNATLAVPFTFQCFIYHRLATSTSSITYPGPGQRNMAMDVISDAGTGGTIQISNIELLNWNYTSSSSQYVSSISFGGVQIATGNSSQRIDPVSYGAPYSGDVSLTPGSTKTLLIVFNRNYNAPTGNEIIKITFTNSSCAVLDSSNPLQVK